VLNLDIALLSPVEFAIGAGVSKQKAYNLEIARATSPNGGRALLTYAELIKIASLSPHEALDRLFGIVLDILPELDQIAAFCDLTGCSRRQAFLALMVHQGPRHVRCREVLISALWPEENPRDHQRDLSRLRSLVFFDKQRPG